MPLEICDLRSENSPLPGIAQRTPSTVFGGGNFRCGTADVDDVGCVVDGMTGMVVGCLAFGVVAAGCEVVDIGVVSTVEDTDDLTTVVVDFGGHRPISAASTPSTMH